MDICKLHSEKKRPMKTLSTYPEVTAHCRDAVFLGCFRLPSQHLYSPQELHFSFLWLLPQTELRIISVLIEWDREKCDAASIGLTLLWTWGRSCSFYALFAQHRIDFLSHVMLSGGAIKEQKSKPKKTSWALYDAFSMPKSVKRQTEKKQKQKQNQALPSFWRKIGRKVSQRKDAFRKHMTGCMYLERQKQCVNKIAFFLWIKEVYFCC